MESPGATRQLCNLSEDDYDRPGDPYCAQELDMLPELAFIGLCT